MQRSGILCAGAWCIDRNIALDHWPQEEMLGRVLDESNEGGCPGHNMSTALKRLGAAFPVSAMGLIGDDEDGRHLIQICDEMGIERSTLEMRSNVATCHTMAMTAQDTGKRTFFYSAGAHAVQCPDDFDFSTTTARIVHMGLPGLHEKLDHAWKDDVSGWVTVLKNARAAGLKPNIELVSVEPEAIRAAALPMLPFLDTLIINDYEAAAISGVETIVNGVTEASACRKAAEVLMERTNLSLAAVHFPMGGVVLARDGSVAEHPSVNVPAIAIAGNNGAGDAFAAGMLFGHHEGWPLEKSLRLAHASAAASLRAKSTTTSIENSQDCLALAERWGWRTST